MKAIEDKRDIIKHLPALRAFALSLTRNSSIADDMVQDTVETAWRKFDRYTPGTNLRAWLFTILRNNFHSQRRKTRREIADPDGALVGQLSVKPDHEGHIRLREFLEAFAQLPVEQREALFLVGANGFTYEEAARTCGCKIGTIKSRLSRGRKRLVELLHLDESDLLEMADVSTMSVVNRHIAETR